MDSHCERGSDREGIIDSEVGGCEPVIMLFAVGDSPCCGLNTFVSKLIRCLASILMIVFRNLNFRNGREYEVFRQGDHPMIGSSRIGGDCAGRYPLF